MFIFGLLIMPISILIIIINIFTYKNCLKKAGECIVLNKTKGMSRKHSIIMLIIIISAVIYSIITKEWIQMLRILIPVFLVVTGININIYAKINGIYKNGLICGGYISWNEVHSYSRVNNDTISFLLESGARVDYNNISNNEKLMETIIEKKLKEYN